MLRWGFFCVQKGIAFKYSAFVFIGGYSLL